VIEPGSLVLLDTNILVRLIRADEVGERIERDYGLLERRERPLISIVTVGEIEALARKLGWGGPKRAALLEMVRKMAIVDLKQGQIILRYAEIDHFCEKESKPARPMGQNDMWIAATASEVEAVLLTTDTDFEHLHGVYLNVLTLDPKTGAVRP
jgi:predicted nucleic acid-binding protein